MLDKYNIILTRIVENDFNNDLNGIRTEAAYEKYIFYCEATGIQQIRDKQIVVRDICSKWDYKSKQIMKAGNRFYVFEKKVIK